MGDAVTFLLDHPISGPDRARAVADRIRGLAASGDPGQPDLAPVLRTVPFVDCAPCIAQAQQDWTDHGTIDWAALTADGTALVEIDPANPGRFVAFLLVEEEQTADRRIIASGAAKWRTPPLSLMLMTKTADGHDGAQVCAVIENIVRQGDRIAASGRFDTGEAGLEAARLVANKILTGVSIDAGDVEGEILVTAEDENGVPTDGIARMTALTILGATICPFQAIGSACIAYIGPDGAMAADDLALFGGDLVAQLSTELAAAMKPHDYVDEDNDGKCDVCGMSEDEHNAAMEQMAAGADETPTVEAVLAAGPIAYAPAMFTDPHLAGPTPITVADDGIHVYGHAAIWGQCHIGFPGTCVTPPRSLTNYGHFRTGSVKLTDGTVQPVGTLVLNASHADRKLAARDASAHYDHTGLAAAFVNVGEDAHGIWVSGILRPDLADSDATVLAASSLSGDWRRIGGNLELVALLSVNTPGFPVAHTLNGEQLALVAAGYGHIPASADHPAPVIELELLASFPGGIEGFARIVEEAIEEHVAPLRTEVAKLRSELRPFRLRALAEAFAPPEPQIDDEHRSDE